LKIYSKKKNSKIGNRIERMANMKFIISHGKNEYMLMNVKSRAFIRITKNNPAKTIKEFKRNTKIDFISMQDIIFSKKDEAGNDNLKEFGKNLSVLKNRLINKYKSYFMAAEKMEIESVVVNL